MATDNSSTSTGGHLAPPGDKLRDDGENYVVWAIKTKQFFVSKRLWRYVASAGAAGSSGASTAAALAGAEAAGEAAGGAEGAGARQQQQQQQTPAEAEAAEQAEAQAQFAICHSIADGLIHQLEGKTAREMWQTLHQMFSQAVEARARNLLNDLRNLTLLPQETVTKLSQRAMAIKSRLANAGRLIDEAEVLDCVLLALSKGRGYDALVSSIDVARQSSPGKLNSIPEVMPLLLAHEQRMVTKRSTNALVASGGGKSSFIKPKGGKPKGNGGNKGGGNTRSGASGSGAAKPVGPCFKCGEMGHIKRDCTATVDNKPARQQSRAATAMMVTVESSSSLASKLAVPVGAQCSTVSTPQSMLLSTRAVPVGATVVVEPSQCAAAASSPAINGNVSDSVLVGLAADLVFTPSPRVQAAYMANLQQRRQLLSDIISAREAQLGDAAASSSSAAPPVAVQRGSSLSAPAGLASSAAGAPPLLRSALKARLYKRWSLFKAFGPQRLARPKAKAPVSVFNATTGNASGHHAVWAIDSGAGRHITFSANDFDSGSLSPTDTTVKFGKKGVTAPAAGVGTVTLRTRVGRAARTITLTDVLYVPEAAARLFSVRHACTKGMKVTLDAHHATVLSPTGAPLAVASVMHDGLYGIKATARGGTSTANGQHPVFNAVTDSAAGVSDNASSPAVGNVITSSGTTVVAATAKVAETPSLWHARMGHLGMRNLRKLVKHDMVTGINITVDQCEEAEQRGALCEPCVLSKQKAELHPTTGHRANEPLDLVHIDITGPLEPSCDGHLYSTVFVDDATSFVVVRTHTTKGQASDAVIEVLTKLSTQLGRPVRGIRCDNGSELISNAVMVHCEQRGIRQTLSPPYMPQANGKAERTIGVIKEKMRSMLVGAGMSGKFWADAMQYAAIVHNVSPVYNDHHTPWQQFFGSPPDISHLRVFGSTAYVLVPHKLRRGGGIRPVSEKGIFIGMQLDSVSYRVMLPDGAVRVSTNVKFDESSVADGNPKKGGSEVVAWGSDAGGGGDSDSDNELDPVTRAPVSQLPMLPNKPGSGLAMASAAAAARYGHRLHSVDWDAINPVAGAAPAAPHVGGAGNGQPPQAVAAAVGNGVQHADNGGNAGSDGDGAAAAGGGQPSPADSAPGDGAPEPVGGTGASNSSGLPSGGLSSATESSGSERAAVQGLVAGREPRVPKPNPRYSGFVVGNYVSALSSIPEEAPTTLEQAKARKDWPRWLDAIQSELASINKNQVWSLVDPPRGKRILSSKWVFTIKRNTEGVIQKHKARLVVRGFMQQEGIDFVDSFAPTSKHTTMRLLLALVAKHNLTLRQCDFVTAFLNGELEEEVYLQPPPGFPVHGKVYRLHKALYGLRQAPRAWHVTLKAELESMGFTSSLADPSLFIKWTDNGPVFVLVYVDDCLVAGLGNTPNSVISDLSSRFAITDLGDASRFVGIEISRDRAAGTLTITQSRMARELAIRGGMGDCKPRDTPLSVSTRLSADNGDPLDNTTAGVYRELVGQLLYMSVSCRPDLAQPVGVLARYTMAPTTVHHTALKGVLRYVAGTPNLGITYGGNGGDGELVGFTDSDYAGDLDQRRSTTGFVFLFANGVISWASRRQKTTAVSTMEAEYMAMAAATKEAVWLRSLLADLCLPVMGSVLIHGDNQAAIKLLKNPVASQRSKHIDIAYHFSRERDEAGEVQFEYISTDRNAADAMTKALPAPKFLFCLKAIGMTG